jgi:enterochelin esterase-like enzyme
MKTFPRAALNLSLLSLCLFAIPVLAQQAPAQPEQPTMPAAPVQPRPATPPAAPARSVLPVLAQLPPSPDVHPDASVTFHLKAPHAEKVLFSLEGSDPVPMEKGDDGIWNYTTPPLVPDDYGYHFIADDVVTTDPVNSHYKANLLYTDNLVHVPSPTPQPWDDTDVPHGIVHHHYYKSAIVGDNRDYFVYTPPGYDPASATRYPVLYLLHGYSDEARGWSAVGYANLILDNLIAQGKARPMLVVMPLGYGAPEVVSRSGPMRDPGLMKRNFERFTSALLTEVLPAVEHDYHVSTDRKDRAIAGLSMGGAESLLTGLNNLDKFAYVGAFSSGGMRDAYTTAFPKLSSADNSRLRLLWIACGRDDGLFPANQQFEEWLKSKQIAFTPIATSGRHTWMVWRRNLNDFAPLLFQPK